MAPKPVKHILASFGLDATEVQEVGSRSRKTIWRIETNQGPFSLIRFVSKSDALFVVAAQEHVHRIGGVAPEVLKTSSGDLVRSYHGEHFSVCRWICGKSPNYERQGRSGLLLHLQGMARMHTAARHFEAPGSSSIRNQLRRWPKRFTMTLSRLKSGAGEEWSGRRGSVVKAFAPRLISIAEDLVKLFDRRRDAYRKAVAKARRERTFIHGDTVRKNVRFIDEHPLFYDFEKAAYNIQVKDIFTPLERMARRYWHGWNGSEAHSALDAYERVLPLTPEERWLLWIDLSFPHRFARMLRRGKKVPVTDLKENGEISLEIAKGLKDEVSRR